MTMILVYLFVAVGFSFLCSILEAVLLSITPSYIAAQASAGTRRGKLLKRLKADIDRPLAAILTLNTFAHTIGAAGVGAEAADYFGEEYLGIVSAVVTVIILIASEIIPKTIGAVYWQRLVGPAVTCTQLLIIMLYPFVWVSQIITRWLRPEGKVSLLTRAEISHVASTGYRDGTLRKNEHAIIHNLLKFTEVATETIMTPREDIIAVDRKKPINAYGKGHPSHTVSRIPLCGNTPDGSLDLDAMDGYILKDELLGSLLERDKRLQPVHTLHEDMISVPGAAKLPELYNHLIESNEHIARVTDASGQKTIGLVTMEDLIEELLGLEIEDEIDPDREKVQQERRDATARSQIPERKSGDS